MSRGLLTVLLAVCGTHAVAVDPVVLPPPSTASGPTAFALYDLTYSASLPSLPAVYEERHLVAAIAGLANRYAPTLFVLLQPADAFWLTTLRQPGGWLASATITNITGIESLVAAFPTVYKGVVLYDPAIWPTSLLATTAAGQESLLPICFRPSDPSSLYSRLVAGGPKLPVLRSFVGAFNATSGTGSVKRNAYDWAVGTYLANGGITGAAAPLLGYYLDYYWTTRGDVGDPTDKDTVMNHDFIIANRGFAFDLSIWTDEAPVDEPNQPLGSDYAAFVAILAAAYNLTAAGNGTNVDPLTHIAGFTP